MTPKNLCFSVEPLRLPGHYFFGGELAFNGELFRLWKCPVASAAESLYALWAAR